jgi:hypothetical protein
VAVPPDPDIDSVSFAPLLHPAFAGSTPPRKYVFAEAFEPNFRPINGLPPAGYVASYHNRTLRNDKYKLIERSQAGGIVQQEFYRMYDDGPLAPPTPQDPSIIPDPHEQVDLMPTMGSWSPEEQAAHTELVSELSTYPVLPVTP